MFCTKCGEKIQDDSVFCMYCGNPIAEKGEEKTDATCDSGEVGQTEKDEGKFVVDIPKDYADDSEYSGYDIENEYFDPPIPDLPYPEAEPYGQIQNNPIKPSPPKAHNTEKTLKIAIIVMAVLSLLLAVALAWLNIDAIKEKFSGKEETTTIQAEETTTAFYEAVSTSAAETTTEVRTTLAVLTTIPTTTPVSQEALTGSRYRVNTQSSDLNMRGDTNTTSSIVGRIPKGTIIEITQQLDGWGYTTFNGVSGWVSMQYLSQ